MAETQATAAYNFVSLPDKILPAELDAYRQKLLSAQEDEIQEAFADFLDKEETFSGSIRLNIETLTPLFIGGNGEQPFAPAGRIILPGSSVRGMVKNLLKIITMGSWKGDEDVNDRHVYYRCLMSTSKLPAWTKDLHKLYTNKMSSMVKGKPVKKAKTGFLLQDKHGNYFICPLLQGHAAKRILIREYENEFSVRVPIKGASVAWHDDKAYVITGSQGRDKRDNDRLVRTMQEYKRIPKNKLKTLGKQFIRYVSLHDADWNPAHWLPVPEAVINDYEDDTSRRGVDLLHDKNKLTANKARSLGAKLSEDMVSVIPCGYLQKNGQISAFGHGLSFRVPYDHSIMDAIPRALKADTIDFAEAMFGNKERWASRVFFEDGEPVGEISTLPTKTAHPLLQPNPTSYQLYLQQDGNKLKHWDAPGGAKIRGYKLYWHNKAYNWQATPDEAEMQNVVRKITPVEKGNHFQAKIRFQNLSAVELGALLMVFDMEGSSGKMAYKLGQGKSLGLGSVRIKPTLYVDDMSIYTNLFTNGRWQAEKAPADGEVFLQEFADYVKAQGMERCWQETMKELAEMLDWQHAEETKGWSARVKSMSGNVQKGDVDVRFRTRAILPTIHEVYKK